MFRVRKSIVPITAVLLASFVFAAAAYAERYALLVGVTKYPSLDQKWWLEGPANDMAAMQRLLTEECGFPAANVRILSERAGADDPKLLPTRDNIAREFAALPASVKPGDLVLIMLAGHGSQQPQVAQTGEIERDGLDEIFLPRDIGRWSGETNAAVERAITDDEIGRWLGAIRQRDAFVWYVVDACHSGDGIKAVGQRQRSVWPGLLDIPKKLVEDAMQRARELSVVEPNEGTASGQTLPVNVAMYACHPSETTVERLFAASNGATEPKCYGLFSYTLAQTLREALRSDEEVSYNELIDAVRTRYDNMARRFPTPLIEGADADCIVLDQRKKTTQAALLLRDATRLDAGQLHGISAGSILSVYPPVGGGDARLGFVRVLSSDMFSSRIEPIAHLGMPAPQNLARGNRCRLDTLDYGPMTVRVTAAPMRADGTPVGALSQKMFTEVVDRQLKEARIPESLVKAVADPDDADWLVVFGSGKIYLQRSMPAGGTSVETTDQKVEGRFGPFTDNPSFAAALKRIAKAQNLLHIARTSDRATQTSRSKSLLSIDISRLTPSGAAPVPIDATEAPISLRNGERMQVDVKNASPSPVDVAIVYIDAELGISVLYPAAGGDCRFLPGQSKIFKLQMSADRPIIEHLLFIGIRADRPEVPRINLSYLQQEKLPTVKAIGMPVDPVKSLLDRAAFGRGGIKGLNVGGALPDFNIRAVTLKIVL